MGGGAGDLGRGNDFGIVIGAGHGLAHAQIAGRDHRPAQAAGQNPVCGPVADARDGGQPAADFRRVGRGHGGCIQPAVDDRPCHAHDRPGLGAGELQGLDLVGVDRRDPGRVDIDHPAAAHRPADAEGFGQATAGGRGPGEVDQLGADRAQHHHHGLGVEQGGAHPLGGGDPADHRIIGGKRREGRTRQMQTGGHGAGRDLQQVDGAGLHRHLQFAPGIGGEDGFHRHRRALDPLDRIEPVPVEPHQPVIAMGGEAREGGDQIDAGRQPDPAGGDRLDGSAICRHRRQCAASQSSPVPTSTT